MTRQRFTFNRLELAGSLGDLGTLLPLAIGMILINGLNPVGVFFAVGLYYVIAGIYFGVPIPVQPMKVIGAYAIATGLPSSQIIASGFTIAVVLLVIGATRAADLLGKYTPHSVVRGVQLSTGALLMAQGIKLIIGTSRFQALQQAAEPYLSVQHIGPVPIGIVIGCLGLLLTLLLLENKKLPAGLVVVLSGIALGVVIGTHRGFDRLEFGLHLPRLLPFAFPSAQDFSLALLILVLPQVPMTLGNAVIAYADLSREYFGENSRLVTYRSACISMALANVISSLLGGMPLCHGAGGLAAHYRFGARGAGSNLIIGAVFLLLVLLLGEQILAALYLMPLSILGVLLVFAGAQLAMTILDMMSRRELFVALLMLGITLGSNLAVSFIAGLIIANLLRSKKLSV